MATPFRAARCQAILALTALCWSCDDVSGPVVQETEALIVSDPVAELVASLARNGVQPSIARKHASESAAAELEVAYISLAPGTHPAGAGAVITNIDLGHAVSTTMIEGGFDPVPLSASPGDSIEIDIVASDGTLLIRLGKGVPVRRPLKIVRTVPPRGKADVPLNANILVVFSEPLDASTVSAQSVHVLRNGIPVAGSVSLLYGVATTVVFEPAAELEPQTEYEIVVSSVLRDLDGDPLDATPSVPFTTGIDRQGPVTSLSLIPDRADVRISTRIQLTLMAWDAAGNVVHGRPIEWISTDPSIATVSPTGLVTAVGEGLAYIEVWVDGFVAALRIEVSETMPEVASVSLSLDSASVTPGATLELTTEARAADGFMIERRLVTWTSSDPSVAEVGWIDTDRGAVLGVASGVAQIVATIEGRSDTTVVTVGPPPPVTGFLIAPDTMTLVLRQRAPLVARSHDHAGAKTPLAGSLVQWATSDASIASIDADGIVTGHGPGNTTVTATWSGYSATARVTVEQVVLETLGAGRSHTCGLTAAGATWCWGATDFGQAGRPGLNETVYTQPKILMPVPTRVAPEFEFAELVAGAEHTCARTTAGAAYCWGWNGSGALGDGTGRDRWQPVPVSGGLSFIALAAGTSHTCGIASDGAAWCWGSNRYGQLGNGSTTDSRVPVAVAGGLAFTALALGETHTCGLTRDGAVHCWGDNASSQLGIGSSSDTRSATPRSVAAPHAFRSLRAGAAHTCAITAEHHAYCWGWNFDGQLGNAAPLVPSAVPSLAAGSLAINEIAPARIHTCAIDADGAALCWGQQFGGRLGNGATGASVITSPRTVDAEMRFADVRAGAAHTCARALDGAWYCWGPNGSGALGIGTAVGAAVPAKVLGQP